MNNQNTPDLIERFRRGDRDAFTPLFEKYRRRLAVMIHYKLCPERRRPEDVEKILRETFCRASRDLSLFQCVSPCSFLNWLSGVADNVIIDCARRHKRQTNHTRFRAETFLPRTIPADSGPPREPGELLRERETLKALIDTLDALPEQHREIVLLAKMEGLSTQEMAESLGESHESVAARLHHAIQSLRALEE
jgi:RNA polymerase sigma-70 factor, ECF subfamily